MENAQNKSAIENAIAIMERKLDEYKAIHRHMKLVNACYKKTGTLDGKLCGPKEIERLTEKMNTEGAERPYSRAELEDIAKDLLVVRGHLNDLRAAKFRMEKEAKKCGN